MFFLYLFYSDLYKPQKILLVGDAISAVNSVLQDTETLWLKRRVGGASISTLQHSDTDNMAYNVTENHGNQMVKYQWNYIIVIIIIVILIVYLLNRWKCLGSKRHSCRKRTIVRIRRVIQTIAMPRIPAQM